MVRYRLRLLYMDCSTSLRASLVRFILAAVPRLLALRQGDFDLGDAVTKINPQRYDGQTLGFDSAGELVNFALVKEQLASTQRLVVPRAAR